MIRTMVIIKKVKLLSPILDWPSEFRSPGGNVTCPRNLGNIACGDNREKLQKQHNHMG